MVVATRGIDILTSRVKDKKPILRVENLKTSGPNSQFEFDFLTQFHGTGSQGPKKRYVVKLNGFKLLGKYPYSIHIFI